MPKTFDPDTELPDLSGKVIVVTGGKNILFLVMWVFLNLVVVRNQ
jgi:hypothetical protein